jgi:CheY-like chemotaxis protein
MNPAPILVVDDDADVRTTLTVILDSEDLPSVTAGNGQVALERIAEQRPGLILLDLLLPDIDGRQLARQIHQSNLAIPIVILTARHLYPDSLESEGVVATMAKPFDLDEFIDVIKRFYVPFSCCPPT